MAERSSNSRLAFIDRVRVLLTGRNPDAGNIPVGPAPVPETVQAKSSESGKRMIGEMAEMFGIARDRFQAYRDYRDMEADSSLIVAALDATADTAVAGAEGDADSVFQVVTKKDDKNFSRVFEDLDKRVRLRQSGWSIIRSFLMMGDYFCEIVVDGASKAKIKKLKPLPAQTMRAIPDEMRKRGEELIGYDQWDPETGGKIAEFQDWQVVHFGMRVHPDDIYCRSMLFSARRTYKQLQAIEDGMVVNRLTRSTLRYVRKVPTPNMTAEMAQTYVKKVQRAEGTRRRYDSNGKLIIESVPMSEETDFYVPVMGNGVEGGVEVLNAQSGSDKIEDVKYFLKRLIMALRTPPSYLGWEEDSAGKAQGVLIDVSFARRVRRVQMAYGIGVRQIIDTELILNGVDPSKVEYDLMFAPIASVDEMRRWQVELLKAQVASMLKQSNLVPDEEYLLRHVLEIEEEFVKDILKKIEDMQKAQDELTRSIAGNVPGGNAPNERFPQPGQETNQPPIRGGANGPTEQLREVKDRIRNRGLVVGPEMESAVVSVLSRRSILDAMRDIYECSQPLAVTAADAKPMGMERIMEIAGVRQCSEP